MVGFSTPSLPQPPPPPPTTPPPLLSKSLKLFPSLLLLRVVPRLRARLLQDGLRSSLRTALRARAQRGEFDDQSLPASTAFSRTKGRCGDADSGRLVTVATSVVQSASAPRAASSAARPKGDNPPWTCPSCDVVIRASCYDKLKTAVWNHWCTRHVGEKMPQRCLFRKTVEPVVASPSIPQDQRDWECPICRVGLPKLGRDAKGG